MTQRALGLASLACALTAVTASGAAAAPTVKYVFPAGLQRGTTVEATVDGTELHDAGGVWLSPAGLVGRIVKIASPTSVVVSIQAPPDAAPGEHDFRIVTPRGASNRYRIFVGQLPEVTEKQNASDRAQAQTLPALPVTVNGQIQEHNRDYFKFTAGQGEVIVLRAQARAILPYIPDAVPGWLDACLTVYDSAGKEIASADDTRLDPDPVLAVPIPVAGEYLVEVKDILDRGKGYFVYRLSLGRLPHIWRVDPMGGRRGQSTHVELTGVNLAQKALDIAAPPDSPVRRLIEVDAGGIGSNAVLFAVGGTDEMQEKEPNDPAVAPMRAPTPCTVNGRIDRPGDVDCFAFQARAGETVALEVHARRLGSLLDSVLAVHDPQGKRLAENDDTADPDMPLLTRHSDARVVVTCPSAGEYTVRVRDIQDKGGDDYAYRLTIGRPRPGFSLRLSPDNPYVARGDSAVITVTATRLDGYNGDIDLTAYGLSAGLSASGATISPGQTTGYMTITAASEGGPAVCGVSVVAAASIDGAAVARTVMPSETVMQAFSYTMYPTARETVVVVGEGGGFTLPYTAPGVVDVPQGGSTKLTLRVVRAPGAAGEVALWPAVPLVEMSVGLAPVPADKDELTVTISATANAPVGLRQNVILTGSMKSGEKTFTRTSPAIPVRVVAARKG